MNTAIYLRPLEKSDASISYQWRNNPLIWKFTKFKAEQPITQSVEKEWIEKTLNSHRDFRFAICIKADHTYVGNVQLVNLEDRNAVFHLFIGETDYWGKGIGQQATRYMIEYGFNELNLETITLEVHEENKSAINIYCKMGFQPVKQDGNFLEMLLTRQSFYPENSAGVLVNPSRG